MPTSLISTLGIAGWSHLDAVVLASVATESPLLLIGPHGSGKSHLLLRLAETLGLAHRHYNASLINLDDLVGFPVPHDGQLIYLPTPATVWDAEAVFVDEISRCRPELQNKLFPLVHERTVQGICLEKLRHRWAAMNPPPRLDANDDGDAGPIYTGAEALDVALADRFAFVVLVPGFDDLREPDQKRVVNGGGVPQADAGDRWREALSRTRARLEAFRSALAPVAEEYVPLVARALLEAKHPISARRAALLGRNIAAIAAASRALGTKTNEEDACCGALRVSLPDAAWGAPVQTATLLAAHKKAWAVAKLAAGDEGRKVFRERDPLRRVARALKSRLDATTVAQVVSDGFSQLSAAERLTSSVLLMPQLAERCDLPACAVEAVAEAYARVAEPGAHEVELRGYDRQWQRDIVSQLVPTLDSDTLRGRTLSNVALALTRSGEPVTAVELAQAWDRAASVLAAGHPSQDDPDPAPDPEAVA